MNRKIACMLAAAASAAAVIAADPVDSSHRVQWLSTVTDGCYNDPACWTDGLVPSNGIDGLYGLISFQSADVTVRVPAEGLVEDSGSIFLGCGSGTHTLTIDTRGTYWQKKAVSSAQAAAA